jgi:hypothetical protein
MQLVEAKAITDTTPEQSKGEEPKSSSESHKTGNDGP